MRRWRWLGIALLGAGLLAAGRASVEWDAGWNETVRVAEAAADGVGRSDAAVADPVPPRLAYRESTGGLRVVEAPPAGGEAATAARDGHRDAPGRGGAPAGRARAAALGAVRPVRVSAAPLDGERLHPIASIEDGTDGEGVGRAIERQRTTMAAALLFLMTGSRAAGTPR